MEKYSNSMCTNGKVVLVLILALASNIGEGQLRENFYSSTCPKVEDIVRQAVATKMAQTLPTIPATLRLFFHDCFVEGCDASIIIASPNNDAEKDAPDNLSIAGDGYDTVIKAKRAVEAKCPGVVSCADILAIAARDVVLLAGGPDYAVELGRRDGLVSSASRVAGNLPEPEFNLARLNAMFAKHNLSQTEMIALSGGGHTLGFCHCNRFTNRLYSFSRTNPVDSTLNSTYARELMKTCGKGDLDKDVVVTLDPATPQTFDNEYFKNLVVGKGLLSSDQVLYTDLASRSTVMGFATKANDFDASFIEAMKKLGRVGVKTGNQGEIRTDCTVFNS